MVCSLFSCDVVSRPVAVAPPKTPGKKFDELDAPELAASTANMGIVLTEGVVFYRDCNQGSVFTGGLIRADDNIGDGPESQRLITV